MYALLFNVLINIAISYTGIRETMTVVGIDVV